MFCEVESLEDSQEEKVKGVEAEKEEMLNNGDKDTGKDIKKADKEINYI